MKNNKLWVLQANTLYLTDLSNVTKEKLDNVIYTIEEDPLTKELYLKKAIEDKFTFNFKVYGLETDFIDTVLHTYKNTTGNLGILSNGLKGTGELILV